MPLKHKERHKDCPSCTGKCLKESKTCLRCSGGHPPDDQGVSVKRTLDVLDIRALGFEVTSVEEALARAKIDPTLWEIVGQDVRWRQTGNLEGSRQLCSIWVKMKRRVPEYVADTARSLAKSLHLPRAKPVKRPKNITKDVMVEMSLFDHHFGRYAWSGETGADYDITIAGERYLGAVTDGIDQTKHYAPCKFLVPIGNDFFHMDSEQATTAGTPVDVDSRWPKVYSEGVRCVIAAVEAMREVAPVHIIWVPGNHDMIASWFLVCVLQERFRGCRDVTVDDGATHRKYVEWGKALIGFTHGQQEKHTSLPTIMATEKREEWARTINHEWHIGHVHRVRKMEFMSVDTHDGVVIRTLPSLSSNDAWHYRKGYLGSRKCAEIYIWSKARGYVGHLAAGYVD